MSKDDFALRTFEGLQADSTALLAADGEKAKAADYNNSIHAPLLTATGQVIKSVSCAPLYIFLGLTDQALKIVERKAACFDEKVKSEHGLASPELGELLKERCTKGADLLECTAKR